MISPNSRITGFYAKSGVINYDTTNPGMTGTFTSPSIIRITSLSSERDKSLSQILT